MQSVCVNSLSSPNDGWQPMQKNIMMQVRVAG